MVNYGIHFAEISYPAVEADIRITVEVRDHFGRSNRSYEEHALHIAKVDAVEVFHSLIRFEFSKRLADENFSPLALEALTASSEKGAYWSDYHQKNSEQLELFAEFEQFLVNGG